MPFRRYRKSYRRSRKLTKANIYSNRGAKAQSRQIAALSSKVNYLARTNRPEILIKFINDEHTFTNSSLSTNVHAFSLNPFLSTYTGDDDAAPGELQGNFCRCKGISLKLISQYSDNWRDTIADASHDSNASYRIVILQTRRSAPPGSSDSITTGIFNNTTTISSADTNVTMPLVAGINSLYKVLYSRAFTISRSHSSRIHNIYIPAKRCLNFIKEVYITDVSGTPKGNVIVAILTGGLHADIDYTSQITMASTLKIAYTDN